MSEGQLMHIKSDGETLLVSGLPSNETIEWEMGTHYGYIHNSVGRIVDQFSFSWEKNKPSMLDFTEALQNWIEYYWAEWELAQA